MKAFNDLLSQAKLAGYKPNMNSKANISNEYQNYEQVFLSLYEALSYMNNDTLNTIPLTAKEMQTFKNEIQNNSDFSSFCLNENVLALQNEILQCEINDIDNEINEIDNEIALYTKYVQDEQIENEKLNKQVHSLNTNEESYLNEQLKLFNENVLQEVQMKIKNLNKSIMSIISELDFNVKKVKNTSMKHSVIGYRKINNEIIDNILSTLTQILNEYKTQFDGIMHNTSLNTNDNDPSNNVIDINKINYINNKLTSVATADIELKKNMLLKQIQLSKEKYKRSIINEYINNPSTFISQSQSSLSSSQLISAYDIEQLIQKHFDSISNEIKFKYTNIKNKYTHDIYSNILLKTKQTEMNFIYNMNQLELIINSLYPYLLCDLNATQDIYDHIVSVIEIYAHFHEEISLKQMQLRKKYADTTTLKSKITVDERDDVMLYLASCICNNESNCNKKVKIYEIKHVLTAVRKFICEYKGKDVVKALLNDVVAFSNKTFSLMGEIVKGIYDGDIMKSINVYKKGLLMYQREVNDNIKMFNECISGVLIKGSNGKVFTIYDVLFLWLFNKKIYVKEFGEMKMGDLIKLNIKDY